MENERRPRPVVLCILDGWGYREEVADNAIAQANTPNWDRMLKENPWCLLETSGLDVGLPKGQMGNSEVGHMNLGAGRVVMQDLPRIDTALVDGSLAENPALARMVAALTASGGALHIMGLLSPGGVHSMQDHMAALVRIVAAAGVKVQMHAFLDGRDTPPKSAAGYMRDFLADIAGAEGFKVATIGGRYWAMDRDRRWDRVEKAWRCMVEADAIRADDPLAAIEAAYAAGQTDEFIEPVVIGDFAGMKDGDGILMANFRADRARQILLSLCDPEFRDFPRTRRPMFAAAIGMTEYSEELNRFLDLLFPPRPLDRILGELVAEAGMTQLRIAETEKYAHVTFFFNGGREKVFPGEERILVPSPKVATYDLQPEMSAFEVTDKLVEAIGSDRFDLVVVNFANGDMVGHSGILAAAIKAAEAVDKCIGRLEEAVKARGGALLVTADHGNCEMMRDPATDQPHTAHTVGKVAAVLIGVPPAMNGLADGRLADVAPTLLRLLGLPQPVEMTGRCLMREPG